VRDLSSFTSIDISAASLAQARDRVRRAGAPQVIFQQADLYRLPHGPGGFDHVFVCFVLEHLRDPVSALAELRRVLCPGGTISVIEGITARPTSIPTVTRPGGPSSA
jgi:ubiquinone/menaquinone biosynthesis C-methylase UbiE